MITPLREDESIDFASGVHGLLITGGQGEFCWLTEEERLVAPRFSRQHAAGRVPKRRAEAHLQAKACPTGQMVDCSQS